MADTASPQLERLAQSPGFQAHCAKANVIQRARADGRMPELEGNDEIPEQCQLTGAIARGWQQSTHP